MIKSDHLEAYGKAIKQLRQFRQMSQTQLAEEAQLRVATISEIALMRHQYHLIISISPSPAPHSITNAHTPEIVDMNIVTTTDSTMKNIVAILETVT